MVTDIQDSQPLADRLDRLDNKGLHYRGGAFDHLGLIDFRRQPVTVELGPDNIRVNAVLPGIVSGDRQRRVMEARAAARGLPFEQIEAEAFSHTAIRDYVTPEQIADQVLYLASPRGRTISGQSLSVCGGTERLG